MSQRDDIKEWLQQKGTTLWGASWSVTAPDTLEQAAIWFSEQMDDFVYWQFEKHYVHAPTPNILPAPPIEAAYMGWDVT